MLFPTQIAHFSNLLNALLRNDDFWLAVTFAILKLSKAEEISFLAPYAIQDQFTNKNTEHAKQHTIILIVILATILYS